MEYWTDQGIGNLVALRTISDPEARERALRQASRVYRYIQRNEGISDVDLRDYAARNDITPDDLNRAIEILRETRKMYVLEAAARPVVQLPPSPSGPTPVGAEEPPVDPPQPDPDAPITHVPAEQEADAPKR